MWVPMWQQSLTIHPNSNRGTENNNQNNFDANGNLLNLNNIGNLEWHYNNTKLVKYTIVPPIIK
jgi:insecticidal toxin complex protein TccC